MSLADSPPGSPLVRCRAREKTLVPAVQAGTEVTSSVRAASIGRQVPVRPPACLYIETTNLSAMRSASSAVIQ